MRMLSALAAILVCLACVQTRAFAVEYALQTPGALSSLLLDIAAAGERLVAVGERGHILVSEDGDSWRQVEVPTTAMLTRVFFIDAQSGWAVGHDGNILHSRDGGLSWSLQRDGLAEQVPINESRASRALARVQQLEARLESAGEAQQQALESALEEARWQLGQAREALDMPVYAPPLMDVWFANEEQGWASGAYGTLLYTANGGRDWADWSYKVGNADELHLNGIAGDGRGKLYLASEWGTVFVSSTGGERWQSVDTGYEGSLFGLVTGPTGGTVLAYGLLGSVYRSTDKGRSWEACDSGVSASLFGAVYAGEALVLVGQGGTVTISRDGGDSFRPLIQSQRDGLYGVASPDGQRFFAAGEGGSRELQGLSRDGET